MISSYVLKCVNLLALHLDWLPVNRAAAVTSSVVVKIVLRKRG